VELGDRSALYETEEEVLKDDQGEVTRLRLKQKDNGDCWYLERGKGCTIWSFRPALCREFDCRTLLRFPRRQRRALVAKGLLRKQQLQAAKRMKWRLEKEEEDGREPRILLP
jgi:hypothetical protein